MSKQYIQNIVDNLKNTDQMLFGTNSWEIHIINKIESLKVNLPNYDKMKVLFTVSGSWHDIIPLLKKLEIIVLFDISTKSLLSYNLTYNLIKISKTRQSFIENLFARRLKGNRLKSNIEVEQYLKQSPDLSIYKTTMAKLKKCNHVAFYVYKTIVLNQIILREYNDNMTGNITVPSFYFTNSKHKRIFGKRIKRSRSTLYTYNYNITGLFKDDISYKRGRHIIRRCRIEYILSDVNHVDIFYNQIKRIIDDSYDKVLINIDTIDKFYLLFLRDDIDTYSKRIQSTLIKHNDNLTIYIIGYHTGTTMIRRDKYKLDLKYIDNYKKYFFINFLMKDVDYYIMIKSNDSYVKKFIKQMRIYYKEFIKGNVDPAINFVDTYFKKIKRKNMKKVKLLKKSDMLNLLSKHKRLLKYLH